MAWVCHLWTCGSGGLRNTRYLPISTSGSSQRGGHQLEPNHVNFQESITTPPLNLPCLSSSGLGQRPTSNDTWLASGMTERYWLDTRARVQTVNMSLLYHAICHTIPHHTQCISRRLTAPPLALADAPNISDKRHQTPPSALLQAAFPPRLAPLTTTSLPNMRIIRPNNVLKWKGFNHIRNAPFHKSKIAL